MKSGDVMEDAARFYALKADANSNIIENLNLQKDAFTLATLHRAENTDNPDNLRNLVHALNVLNKRQTVVLPMHPRTRKIIDSLGLPLEFVAIEPVGYFDMIRLLKNCNLVITDSGGLQKEAFFFRKYCITTREQTEWVELVDNHYNFLAGTNTDKIVSLFDTLQDKAFPEVINLYGNGLACATICQKLLAS